MKISNIEEYKLEINNKEQIIQGIYILGKEVYQQIRFVVEMEHLEGWNPTRNDIQYLLDTVKHPNPKLDVEIDKLFGDRVDERWLYWQEEKIWMFSVFIFLFIIYYCIIQIDDNY